MSSPSPITLQSFLREEAAAERLRASAATEPYVQAASTVRAETLTWVAELIEGLASIQPDGMMPAPPVQVVRILQRLGEEAEQRAREILCERYLIGLDRLRAALIGQVKPEAPKSEAQAEATHHE